MIQSQAGVHDPSPLTHLKVARGKLLAAIDLFFHDGDPPSIYSLAGDASEILEELCRDASREHMTDTLLRDHPGKLATDIYNAKNLYRNAFKHVGRTLSERAVHKTALSQYREPVNDFILYVAVEDYIRLRRSSPIPFQVYQLWFGAVHIDLLDHPRDPAPFRDSFPGITDQARAAQKRRGREMMARWIDDAILLANPDTEPLVLEGNNSDSTNPA